MLKGKDEVSGSKGCCVGAGCLWHFHVFGVPLEGVADALGLGFGHIDLVSSVMFQRRSHIPCFYAMGGPCASCLWHLVGQHFCSKGPEWCFVEIEFAVKLGLGQELGVDVGISQQIEGDEHLG